MAISPAGTFRYVVVVPDGAPDSSRDWPATSLDARVGNHNAYESLVGPTPTLRINDAGLTPDPSRARPRVLRSRLTLTARTSHLAAVAGASFCVDKAIVGTLQPGDHLHMVRTPCGGLGVSVVRDNRLVAAAGAVTNVPLGNDVHARISTDRVDAVAGRFGAGYDHRPVFGGETPVFIKRDPEFRFLEDPVEFTVGEQVRICSFGRPSLEPYRLAILHGFLSELPGQDERTAITHPDRCPDECAAIWHPDRCPDVAASATARLLDLPTALCIDG